MDVAHAAREVGDLDAARRVDIGIGATTRVTRYPNGISPVGCYDMAGNVCEWTKSEGEDPKGTKVRRGGSWDNDRDGVRYAYRSWADPRFRDDNLGFRCVGTMK